MIHQLGSVATTHLVLNYVRSSSSSSSIAHAILEQRLSISTHAHNEAAWLSLTKSEGCFSAFPC